MKRIMVLMALMVGSVITARASEMFFDDFDGTYLNYGTGNTILGEGWVDYSDRNSDDGFAISAEDPFETVLAGVTTANDMQIRSQFNAGLDASAITNMSLRWRSDESKDGIFNDGAVMQLRWGAGSAAGTLVVWDVTTSSESNGWHTATVAYTNNQLSGTMNAFRIDVTSGTGIAWEMDYFKIEGTGAAYEPPGPLSTNTVVAWEFNGDDDTEGWEQASNDHIDGLTTAGGVLTSQGVLANDPQILRGNLYSPNGEYWFQAQIRARQLDTNGVPRAWDPTGCALVIDGSVISQSMGGSGWDVKSESDGWITASTSINYFGTNLLYKLRFDPIGGESATNTNFEVDYFRLTTTPLEPPVATGNYLIESWEFNTPGDTEGFYSENISSLTVAADINGFATVLTCDETLSNDPKVYASSNSVLSLPANGWSMMETRVRQVDAGGNAQLWDGRGTIVLLNNTINLGGLPSANSVSTNEANNWMTFYTDISSVLGDITSLRIDPIGHASNIGKKFEIDYIRFYTSVVPGFDQFVYDYQLIGPDALESADPDEDSADNFTEYAFGGDPNDELDVGATPMFESMANVGGTNVLTYIYYRLSSPLSGVTYDLQESTDLRFGAWDPPSDYVQTGVGTHNSIMEAVTNLVPVVGDKKFIQVKAVGQ